MTDTDYCEEHDQHGPCPVCQLPKVAIPGSGVITRSGKRKDMEEQM